METIGYMDPAVSEERLRQQEDHALLNSRFYRSESLSQVRKFFTKFRPGHCVRVICPRHTIQGTVLGYRVHKSRGWVMGVLTKTGRIKDITIDPLGYEDREYDVEFLVDPDRPCITLMAPRHLVMVVDRCEVGWLLDLPALQSVKSSVESGTMIEFYTFDECELNVGARKTEKVKVSVEIKTWEDDEYAEQEDQEQYTDGVRLQGELIIDVYFGNNYLRPGTAGSLKVCKDGESSKFNIVLMDMLDVKTIVPMKQKRYFWLFYGIGKPMYDELELFPYQYKAPELKVFTITDFRGHSPVSVAALVVAKDRKEGRRLMDERLKKAGLADRQEFAYTLKELDLTQPQATILVDGSDF
jgi:hypothetical protein